MDLADVLQKCSPAKVLAVSKLQTDEKIRELYDQGQRDFGENYVQEFVGKIERLQDLKDIQWHFIGHLQRNKAKALVSHARLIHSVDSMELAEVIDKQAEKLQVRQDILIQVNLANEDSKGGFSKAHIIQFWPLLCQFSHLNICGLMTMPPLAPAEMVRPYFKELKELFELLKKTTPPQHRFAVLSMGTSGDYLVAIEEGATIVRLGTILFGERATKRWS